MPHSHWSWTDARVGQVLTQSMRIAQDDCTLCCWHNGPLAAIRLAPFPSSSAQPMTSSTFRFGQHVTLLQDWCNKSIELWRRNSSYVSPRRPVARWLRFICTSLLVVSQATVTVTTSRQLLYCRATMAGCPSFRSSKRCELHSLLIQAPKQSGLNLVYLVSATVRDATLYHGLPCLAGTTKSSNASTRC